MSGSRGPASMAEWTTREQLILASAVQRSGDQNWVSVSRAVKPLVEDARPADYFSQKNCALQYSSMLDKAGTPKRKRSSDGTPEIVETAGQQIVRQLTEKHLKQTNASLKGTKQEYLALKKEIELLEKGELDSKLPSMWSDIQAELASGNVEAAEKKESGGSSILKLKSPPRSTNILKAQSHHRKSVAQSKEATANPHPHRKSVSEVNLEIPIIKSPNEVKHKKSTELKMELGSSPSTSHPKTPVTPQSTPSTPGSLEQTLKSHPGISIKKESITPSVVDFESPTPRSVIPVVTPKEEKFSLPMQTPHPSTQPSQINADVHVIVQQPNTALVLVDTKELVTPSAPLPTSPPASSKPSKIVAAAVDQMTVSSPQLLTPSTSIAVTVTNRVSQATTLVSSSISDILNTQSPAIATKVAASISVSASATSLQQNPTQTTQSQPISSQALPSFSTSAAPQLVTAVTAPILAVASKVSTKTAPAVIPSQPTVQPQAQTLPIVPVVSDPRLSLSKHSSLSSQSVSTRENVPTDGADTKPAVSSPPVTTQLSMTEPTTTATTVTAVASTTVTSPTVTSPAKQPTPITIPAVQEQQISKSIPLVSPQASPTVTTGFAPVADPMTPPVNTVVPQATPEQLSKEKTPTEQVKVSDKIELKTGEQTEKPKSEEAPEEVTVQKAKAESDRPQDPRKRKDSAPVSSETKKTPTPVFPTDLKPPSTRIETSPLVSKSKSSKKEPIQHSQLTAAVQAVKDKEAQLAKTQTPTPTSTQDKGTPTSSPPSSTTSTPIVIVTTPKNSGTGGEDESMDVDSETPVKKKPSKANLKSDMRKQWLTRSRKRKTGDEGPSVESTDTEEEPGSSFTSAVSSPAPSQSSEMDAETLLSHKQWKKAIIIVWRHAAQHKYANLFLHPVREEDAPGYKDVILRPMDLSTIKKKIDSGLIKTDIEFQRDMLLMFQNAFMYNRTDHDVYFMAQEMKNDVMDDIQAYLATQAQLQLMEEPTPPKTLRSREGRRAESTREVHDDSIFSPAKKRRTRADD